MDGSHAHHGGSSSTNHQSSYFHQSRQAAIIGENAAMCAVAIIAVALRFYARRVAKTNLWWDDWITLLGLPYSLAQNIFSAQFVRAGQGAHLVTILRENPSEYFKQLYFQFVIYPPSLVFFKIAMLFFYVRLFPLRWIKLTTWALGFAICIWCMVIEFLVIFQCKPIHRVWNRDIPGTCLSREPLFLAQSIPTIIFDVIILGLAVPLICGVKLPQSSKLALIGIFMMGGLVTVISIVRLHYALQPVSSDFTWNYVDLGLWSDTEAPIGLLSVCLPTYGPLFRKLLLRVGSSRLTASEVSTRYGGDTTSDIRPVLRANEIGTPVSEVEAGIWAEPPDPPPKDGKDGRSRRESESKSGFITVTKDIRIDESLGGRNSSCGHTILRGSEKRENH
ncbi:MAG: hypothetical protein M1820_007804 [Bogoriella megaspora]|nr:MAG: hypothetical protein M1820_007804 [Bogoriella megaspora]